MFVCPVCPFVSRLPPVSFYRYVPTDRYTGRRAASFIDRAHRPHSPRALRGARPHDPSCADAAFYGGFSSCTSMLPHSPSGWQSMLRN